MRIREAAERRSRPRERLPLPDVIKSTASDDEFERGGGAEQEPRLPVAY